MKDNILPSGNSIRLHGTRGGDARLRPSESKCCTDECDGNACVHCNAAGTLFNALIRPENRATLPQSWPTERARWGDFARPERHQSTAVAIQQRGRFANWSHQRCIGSVAREEDGAGKPDRIQGATTNFTSLIPLWYVWAQHTVLRRGLLIIRFCVSFPVFLRNHNPKLPFRCTVNVTRTTPFCDFSILICKKHSVNCILSQKHLRRFLYGWL